MPEDHPEGATRFAGYPTVHVHDKPTGKRKSVQHLIWGDWLRITGPRSGSHYPVHTRGVDGWMHKDDIQVSRLLEIAFLDVGQGDGCLLVTPDDQHMVIDAGQFDNMYRFLRWRYGGFRDRWEFVAGVMTHPDQDHYGGFGDIFQDPNVTFETLYHNGIMERFGKDGLGPKKKVGGRTYLSDLIRSKAALESFLAKTANWRKTSGNRTFEKQFPAMLKAGLDNGSFKKFRALSVADGFLPGFEEGKELSIRVLGPVPEPVDASKGMLRSFGSDSKTKNGHSVVLRLQYKDVSVFLGGDLNIPSQKHLLQFHTGLDPTPTTLAGGEALIAAAQRVFQVDVAKACHHGAADISTNFLAALNPIATVISSGDDEPHSHPRADALGATGARSRGTRPLILSTELARSTKDVVKQPGVLRHRLMQLREDIQDAPEGSSLEKRMIKEFNDIVGGIQRSVAVYGSIQLRSDGRSVLLAQKLERPRGSTKWDTYQLEPRGTGPLRFVSKYED